jgi:hypothetical protein
VGCGDIRRRQLANLFLDEEMRAVFFITAPGHAGAPGNTGYVGAGDAIAGDCGDRVVAGGDSCSHVVVASE